MGFTDELHRVRRTTGDDRVVLGVAGGIARSYSIDPVLVRIAFVFLILTNGIGILLYLTLGLVLADDRAGELDARRRPTKVGERAIGIGLLSLGLLLLVRRFGLALPDEILWPAAVIAIGAAVAWSQLDGRTPDLADNGRSVVLRVVAGAVLLAVGVGIFAALNERLAVATQIVVAVVVTTGGVVLLAGPWIMRLGRQLAEERVERIRADERAEVAAHLHDSVLQTLALIQRRAHSPADTIALARRQERELRAWLYGDVDDDDTTLAAVLRTLADEVEGLHAITVEVVAVGDIEVDDDVAALLGAIREAVVNAAKHSGAPTVSVYVEVDHDDGAVVAFVRDRGCGFDTASVADDRRGIADSINARMVRHGGYAEVTSTPGEGTEVAVGITLTPRTDAKQEGVEA